MADEAGLDVAEPGTDGAENRARIEAVHFEEWAPLGGPVTLALSPRRTVLVGRNGCGKSLLLEGLDKVVRSHAVKELWKDSPRVATIDLRTGTGEEVHIRYRIEPKPIRNYWTGNSYDLVEECWLGDSEKFSLKSALSKIEEENKKNLIDVKGTKNVRQKYEEKKQSYPREFTVAETFFDIFLSLEWVRAEMPQSQTQRRDILWNFKNPELQDLSSAEQLNQDLANLRETNEEVFEEIGSVGRRIGIWQTLSVEVYSPTYGHASSPLGAVLVDGVNIGRVSDGTLRILSILLALIDRSEDPLTLLIDEPELGIHPGLLARLLNEIDAYGSDAQVVIATHSPQVVSWARPEELRLVERTNGRTTVRSLTEAQADRVHHYLQDQGSLGDFVYGGGLDD